MKQQKIVISFNIKASCCICTLMLLLSFNASAQKERKFVREGNREYKKGHYDASQTSYLRALNIDSTSYEALFNLSDALYQQENYDEALKISKALAADSTQTSDRISSNLYNLGNIYFQKKEYQKAIDEYKKSLRINPDDYEVKFNLAYAQEMLKNQQNQQEQNKDQQNKDDKKDDQNSDKDKKDQPQDQNKDDNNKDKQDQQPQEGEMSKKDAEKILKAMQNNENKTQEKVKAKKGTPINIRGLKNW